MASPPLTSSSPAASRGEAPLGLGARFRSGKAWVALAAWILAVAFALLADFRGARTVRELSAQGSAPPPRDATSATGYVGSQRHYLGTHERGDTYRWIAASESLRKAGSLKRVPHHEDNIPQGRPALEPVAYTGWLVAVAWLAGFFLDTASTTSEALPFAEPILLHLLAIIGITVLVARRTTTRLGLCAGVAVACLPTITEQFLPGVLTPRTAALLLGSYAISGFFFTLIRGAPLRKSAAVASAGATALALWLEPAIGFPIVLFLVSAACWTRRSEPSAFPLLLWSVTGSAFICLAWLADGAPWVLAAGELRYVHPWYAFAWLGAGLVGHGIVAARDATAGGARRWAPLTAGLALLGTTVAIQIQSGFPGWLYPVSSLRRLSSRLEGIPPAQHLFAWANSATGAEALFALAPVAVVAALLAAGLAQAKTNRALRTSLVGAAILMAGLTVLACFRVRLLVLIALAGIPLACLVYPHLAGTQRHVARWSAACGLFILLVWRALTAMGWPAPEETPPLDRADQEALVFRHFSHWFATHAPSDAATVLAPPALSDSLVFHARARTLISTAWETHAGHVAASRILSAPDSNEVEGLLDNRGINYVVLNSWDGFFPQFVRAEEKNRNETFHARLQRWVFPPFLRPIPYHLPARAGFEGQVIVVLRRTETQDEALALSRLAEYFVEMKRDYLANAASRILGQSFRDDPNAQIARALVLYESGDQAALQATLSALLSRPTPGDDVLPWDRRVQRVIALALGGRHEAARAELARCLDTMDPAKLHELTPLQAFRLLKLSDGYRLPFPQSAWRELAQVLCAEYLSSPPASGGP